MNDMPEVRRRGRPPMDQAEPAATDAVPKRRRRAKLGEFAMKLAAPSRPGFTRRWVNDKDMRIAELEELGYDFVSEPDTKSNNVGSRISRLVGDRPNGDALNAFLMETPDELYAEGLAEKEASSVRVDEAIRAGSPTDSAGLQQLTSGEGSIKRDR